MLVLVCRRYDNAQSQRENFNNNPTLAAALSSTVHTCGGQKRGGTYRITELSAQLPYLYEKNVILTGRLELTKGIITLLCNLYDDVSLLVIS